jgi:N-acetylglucosamine-6-sulfatase
VAKRIGRKKISRSTFLFGVTGAVLLASRRPTPAQIGARSNVLWIVDDDHPPYMMDPMPVTRRHVREAGIDLHGGHADIPLCGPARASLLTGLSVTTHGCDDNGGTYNDFRAAGLDERTVARHMKDAGFATAHFGKYINAHASEGTVPPHWDRWCETKGDGNETGGGGDADSPNQGNVDGTWVDIPEGLPSSVWAARRCAEWVGERAGTAWFAQYCPTFPHAPFTPTSRSAHLYDDAARRVPWINEADMSDKPKWMRDLPPADAAKMQKHYEGMKEELADLDYHGMRPILAALEESGQLANTVIFFTSDNGYLLSEHRLRKKDHPYWECSQVPFFVRGPGVRGGARRGALVNHTDLAPTTCEVAGLSPALLEVDGRSMLPHLGGDRFDPWRERMLVTGSSTVGPEFNPGGADNPSGQWWLLREGPKAFVLHENGAKELYRMGADPHQLRSKDDEADPALIERLTLTTKAMSEASGEERRRLEAAPFQG